MSVLYLGIDPSRWKGSGPLLHYPVIRTEPILFPMIPDWPLVTHLIFTSRSAVKYWRAAFIGKQLIAIGEATAQLLREQGEEPLVAAHSTQEGVIELLETGLDSSVNAYFVWPRSTLSRDLLETYFLKRKLRYLALDIYQTVFQCPKPVPILDHIDEIIFTSPSTVEAFLQIYQKFPSNKKLTAIGPITQKYLNVKNSA